MFRISYHKMGVLSLFLYLETIKPLNNCNAIVRGVLSFAKIVRLDWCRSGVEVLCTQYAGNLCVTLCLVVRNETP